MNARTCSAPPPARLSLRFEAPARRLLARLVGPRARPTDDLRSARRASAAALVEGVLVSDLADTVAGFEAVLNGCLDLGYRAEPLAAFVFTTLQARLAGRVRRRLASSGQDPESAEVADLVSSAAESIHRLLRGARRARHDLRYALLLSVADHRTIDHLRRRRPQYRGDMDELLSGEARDGWPASATLDPEATLRWTRRQALAQRLRQVVLDAVNALPTRERAALVLVEVEGIGYGEVARRLGIPRTDVGNVVRRARLARDRALVPLLRGVPELGGHLGYGQLRADRALRVQMVEWSADIGQGLCGRCAASHFLHPAERPCPPTA